MCTEYVFATSPNHEDPDEVGGFFAYNKADLVAGVQPEDCLRGFGSTRYEALACLLALLAEQDDETWQYARTNGFVNASVPSEWDEVKEPVNSERQAEFNLHGCHDLVSEAAGPSFCRLTGMPCDPNGCMSKTITDPDGCEDRAIDEHGGIYCRLTLDHCDPTACSL